MGRLKVVNEIAEGILSKLPKGSAASQAKVAREMEQDAAEKAALYTAAPIANKKGNDAIAQAKKTLAPKQSGKEKFLSNSAVKEPVYHAAKTDVKEFSPEYRTSVSNMGHHFGTSEQANFRIGQYDFDSPSPNIGKYYLNIQNPLEVTHMGSFAPDHLAEQMMDMGILSPKQYEKIQDKNDYFDLDVGSDLVKILKKNKYDGLKYPNEREGEGFSYVPFDSTQIKSAIGNRGTYDVNEADITKAHGGHVHLAKGGVLHLAKGSQEFPLRKPAEVTEADMTPTEVNPLAGKASRLLAKGNQYLTKPFGYENPPMEMLTDFLGVPSYIKSLENVAYGTPNYSGSGQAIRLNEEAVDPLLGAVGTVPVIGPAAKTLSKVGRKVVKAGKDAAIDLAPYAANNFENLLQKYGASPNSYVIKPEGGNWMIGASQNFVKPLRRKVFDADPDDLLKDLKAKYGEQGVEELMQSGMYRNIHEYSAINRFVDKKLTKYIQNEMGTPTDPLRLQADSWAVKQQELIADKQKQIDKVRADIEKAQRERNVEPEVLTRSQTRLRQLQQEQDFIKNRKGIHADPEQWANSRVEQEIIPRKRKKYGMPEDNTATSQAGKSWEDKADKTIYEAAYKDQVPFMDDSPSAVEMYESLSPEERVDFVQKYRNMQLEKVGGKYALENPDAMSYNLDGGVRPRSLGLDHLVDELQNSMLGGVPESLQLTPKTLDKMSVAQVVEHVDKVNAWRASQKAEVNKARAANAATVEHKIYDFVPNTDIPNKQGLRWVEIKTPDNVDLPEGYSVQHDPSRDTNGNIVKDGYRLISPEGKFIEYGSTPEQAAKNHFGRQAVEDALKYEGEILEHCVGGYCPDVMEGKSRIFSLRDADGRPHATIETKPLSLDYWDNVTQNVGRKKAEELWNEYRVNGNGVDLSEFMKSKGIEPLQKITQIKGKKNQKPAEEYIPFVQDFVKSGTWSDIGDMRHTNLYKVTEGQKLPGFSKDIPPGYYTLDEFQKMAVENEMPEEILDSWMTKLTESSRRGWAEGGAVEADDDDLMSLVEQHFAEGGEAVSQEFPVKNYNAGRTRAGTRAEPFPFQGQIDESVGAIKKLFTDPDAALSDVAHKYFPMDGDSPEVQAQKLEDLALGFTGNIKTVKAPRMSAAEAKEAGLWHPISKQKLTIPFDQMTRKVVKNPAVKMSPDKIITPEDMVGGAGFPLIGDRAATGLILKEINGIPLAWDVNLTGGPLYMRANYDKNLQKSGAWESGKGKVTALQNQIERAADQVGDKVYGIYSSGSHQQGDFNAMMSNALAAQLPALKIGTNAANTFDDAVRKIAPKFVGINSPKFKEQLLDKSNGVIRKAFVEEMAKTRSQLLGFPDVASTRKAIMDANIVDDPLGTTGYGIAKMDTNRTTVTPKNPSDYPVSMAGQHQGRFEIKVPFDEHFRTKQKERRLLGADPAHDYRSYELAQPVQIYDQEWLDGIMGYLEKQKKIIGKRIGGRVSKAEKKVREKMYALDANEPKRTGIAPYGLRYASSASETPVAKGKGYYGEMRGSDGAVTELSLDDEMGSFPSVTPNQTKANLEEIKRGKVSDSTYELAKKYADKRRGAGRSPFADPNELRYPQD